MRWRLVVPLATTVAVAGAAAFVVVDHDGASVASGGRSAVVAPVRPPVLGLLPATSIVPSQGSVRGALARVMRSLPPGERVGGAVVDVATGKTLWSRGAATPVAPASTLKVLTAAAGLRSLGPDYRFSTATRAVGRTVYLVGGGDPTLARTGSARDRPVRYPEPASLADLAARTAAALPAGRPVHLRADASSWSSPKLAEGWNDGYFAEGDVTPPTALELDGGRLRPGEFDSPRTTDPAGQAAQEFAALLRKAGVDVRGSVDMAKAPTTARTLATVSSPPLSALVQRMLTDSDNDLAEAVGRAVARHDGLPATFAGASAAVTRQVVGLGVPPAELSLQDTSGLSHDDTVSPGALVTVLRTAALPTSGALRWVLSGLPVAGFTGTLADRYRDHPAGAGAGVVRAKTGSLVGVNTLAGVVVNASGRMLAFAFLGFGTTETDAVQTGLDRMASALAALQ